MDALVANYKVSEYTQIYSGGKFYPLAPSEKSMLLSDVAIALSKLCRFNGHCEGFYSVAQHSVLVSHMVPDWCAREGLMHDAAEAWIGDLVAPVKHSCPDYMRIEDGVELVAAKRFNLIHPMPDAIKRADLRALATEKRDLLGNSEWCVGFGIEPHPDTIIPLEWEEARRLFLHRAKELGVS